MKWLQDNRKVAVVVGLTLAVPLILVLYFVISMWTLGRGYQEDIDNTEPRIARLMGASQSEEQLLAAAKKVESRAHKLVYPATDDVDTVSAALQKNVRGIMSDAGLVVADSRIESARREGAFDQIGLSVSLSGTIDALDEALREVVSYTPLLLVTDIDVTPARSSGRRDAREEQTLTVKMHLLALRSVE